MMTLAQLTALHRTLRDQQVLSVYIDGTVADPANQRSWRVQLDNSLKNIREWLSDSSHSERELFQGCIATLDGALSTFSAGFGGPGWIAFINKDGIAESHVLPVVVPTLAVWSTGPAIAPYVRALKETRPVIVVLADASSANLYRYELGKVEHVDMIRAHHVVEPPSHMGSPPKQGFHSGTRGTAGKDSAQRSLLEGRDRMIQEIVRSAMQEAGDDSFILIGGIKRVTSRIEKSLEALAPDRVLELEGLDIHATADDIAKAARAGASELRAAADNRRLSEIADQAGAGGLGALGPDATRVALDNASVRDLFLTHRYLENNAAEAERAVRAALEQHASVEEVSSGSEVELEKFGGMAAGLRFRPPAMTSATPL
jgi:hypothetical protein